MTPIIQTIHMAGLFLGLFGAGEALYHWARVKADLTRKIVHIGTGILVLFFPGYVENPIWVAGLCLSFLFILLASKKWNLLPSINNVARITYGSYLYPVIVALCYALAFQMQDLRLYYLPILTLAICDPIAEWVGKSTKWHPYSVLGGQKTLGGSIGFAVTSMVVTSVVLYFTSGITVSTFFLFIAPLGLSASFVEGISHKGWDNITVPGTVTLLTLAAQWLEVI